MTAQLQTDHTHADDAGNETAARQQLRQRRDDDTRQRWRDDMMRDKARRRDKTMTRWDEKTARRDNDNNTRHR
ncbi:hypothetical protein CPC08DRAFT_706381 [Agrocybe pediades]|nr:hypothetical protein CPC08DRAFT_706381 [Agrocybe pediades]